MNIASFIDHTILKPTTVFADVEKVCDEAIQYQFASVCIPPYYVSAAAGLLKRSEPKVCTVIGFPFGYAATAAKEAEMKAAIQEGADELDLVLNLAALKNRDLSFIETELERLSAITHSAKKTLKLILETGILTEEEIGLCCGILKKYPIQFAKTSTGYAEKGATVAAVQRMRALLPSSIGIKASGGIKSWSFARELVAAGASRLGCSASVAIVNGALAGSNDY